MEMLVPFFLVALTSLRALWQNVPPSWNGFGDPCGDCWDGVVCAVSRVTAIDLSYNKGLTGSLPPAIGSLSKLTSLILVGCSFNGELPSTLGYLSQLVFLLLNSNSFSGGIPNSIGKLSNLYWLDLAENKLTGTLPVSNGNTPDCLSSVICSLSSHFGRNQLSGPIPQQLLNENMTLIHLRLDWSSLSGHVPSNVSNLTSVTDLDLSNNTFDASDFPSSLPGLPALTTLYASLKSQPFFSPFEPGQGRGVILKKNRLSGALNLGTSHGSQLQHVDLQNNNISAYTIKPGDSGLQLILAENPICADTIITQSYCILLQQLNPSYTTPQNCAPVVCLTSETSWISAGTSNNNVQFTASRIFSLVELKKMTNDFSQVNAIGTGAFGKVYSGTLTNGQLIAVKKGDQGSVHGGLEFKTEIELLSRVHHKNLAIETS
ncbi:hypothetical protein Cgig2_006427 [Carnegiea gigantea]|uniref:Protein kinase domain-containing protein n=1 Tax=Carnegiea gigantea TaxID=171969 RepID=A0A9Q1JL94_9CARY|nr:hypothetical protein Cgig2_006427 [Carnegiea gigantea]